MKKKLLMMIVFVMMLPGCGKADVQNTESGSSEVKDVSTEETTETESESETTSDTSTSTHEHTYVEKVTVAATCTQKGEKTFTCECGDTYTEEIALSAHSYGGFTYNNDATQSADGTKSRTCSVCSKVDTQTAAGTKLPFDPYSLRAVTSLDDIPSAGTITATDNSIYDQVIAGIKAGKYEKIRYIASNGDQFCMWNVRITDEYYKEEHGFTSYYWLMAPIGDKFTSGYQHGNFTSVSAEDADARLSVDARTLSNTPYESLINRNFTLPDSYQEITSSECPVKRYEIVDTDKKISVWIEGTNCGQKGIGTCNSFQCTQTCLRYQTMKKMDTLRWEKGWTRSGGGEGRHINWNGLLLVEWIYYTY